MRRQRTIELSRDIEDGLALIAPEKRGKRESSGRGVRLRFGQIVLKLGGLELGLGEVGLTDVAGRKTLLLSAIETREKVLRLAQPFDSGLSALTAHASRLSIIRDGVRRSRYDSRSPRVRRVD
jgi:hypothetical protein